MKLCTQCKWYHVDFIGSEHCARPELLSKVDGKPDRLCIIERDSTLVGDKCGPNGKRWEERPPRPPKKTWWQWFMGK